MELQNCHPNTSTSTVARGMSNLGATPHSATLHGASATSERGPTSCSETSKVGECKAQEPSIHHTRHEAHEDEHAAVVSRLAAGGARIGTNHGLRPLPLVAEAPWSVAEWAVALRFDIPRATVLVRLLGDTTLRVSNTVFGFQTLYSVNAIKDHPNIPHALKTIKTAVKAP